MTKEFRTRKFAPGVLIAFIRFFRELDALGQKYANFEAFKRDFPIQSVTGRGGQANTLIVSRRTPASGTLSIRPAYNKIETFFRSEHKRLDYPNGPGHATQSWTNYVRWLGALLQMTLEEVASVEKKTIQFVLTTLKSHEIDPTQLAPMRRAFTRLLQEFDFTARKGEPRGGAFQGVAYAYIRADAPHLQLDIAKVQAGSSRLHRVADVNGWQGERLILSAEVKHTRVTSVDDFAKFANEVARRNALGLVVAESFDDNARAELEGLGLRALDREDLIDRVDIWDPLKQEAAVEAFAYYVCHVEQKMALIERLRDFLKMLDSPS